MKRRALTLIFSFVFGMIGFNTLDAMMWNFYYHPWHDFAPNAWALTPTFYFDVWLSYALLGIAPLTIGAFLLGYAIAKSVG